jgi:uncharacterized damage-inducible protein DinB
MSRERIETYAGLLQDVFERRGPDHWAEHSFVENLRDLEDEDWSKTVAGGTRPIAHIAFHVGSAAYRYADSMFGNGSLTWDELVAQARGLADDRDGFIDWIGQGHGKLVDGLRSLADDAELAVPRKAFWGEAFPTERIIVAMIEHFTYHAGEINHLRALLHGNDHFYGGPPPSP